MLENNPEGLERAEIEQLVRNQNNRLLRQQHGSKALSTLGGTTTADRGEKERRPRNRFEGSSREKRRSAARSTGAGAGAAAGITRTQKGNTGGAARP